GISSRGFCRGFATRYSPEQLPGACPVGADSGSLIKYLSSQPTQPTQGAIAQLGERIVRNDEVVGSIPTSSTIFSTTYETVLKITFNLTAVYWNTIGTLGTDRST